MIDIFSYFTVWSLLVSYSIFVWSIFMNIPIWLFLTGACFLTMTSIMGTFFLTMPTLTQRSKQLDISSQQVILADSFIHSGPLILFLVLFNVLSKRLKGTHDLRKTVALTIIISIGYLGYMKFATFYESYDYFCLIILSACIFLSSYQIYLNLIVNPA